MHVKTTCDLKLVAVLVINAPAMHDSSNDKHFR